MAELKPCPFCAARERIRVTRADLAASDLYEVWCSTCGARGPVCVGKSAAARFWNRRLPAPPASEGER